MDEYEKGKEKTKRHKKIKKILKKKWGYKQFRPLQYKIINYIINQKDVTAILPTGYGKSLCFQLPALYTDEPAIVISPLISLMYDQMELMKKIGIKSCCYNSRLTSEEKDTMKTDILDGVYSMVYITPESVMTNEYFIKKLHMERGISLFAIDEAHCISAYGYDFRPSYRDLDTLRFMCKNVPILAVTATATEQVIEDINKVMEMDGIVVKSTFDRPNLHLNIDTKTDHTLFRMIDIIKKSKGANIVYCVTKKSTDSVGTKLKLKGIKVGVYHAGRSLEEREETQKKFMDGVYTTIVATVAFGMGINKSNVRNVFHYGCPKNIESYYQEIGRAGRDGKDANCYMYYSTHDFVIQQKIIDSAKNESRKTVLMRLLDVMSKFINTKGCRKKYILEYFGDTNIKDKCDKCDNCKYKKEDKGDKMSKGNEELIKKYGNDMFRLLTTVKDINCSLGKTNIIGVVRGSKSKKIPERYYKLRFYGSGKSSNVAWWNKLYAHLIDYRYVETFPIKPMIYVPRVTDKARKFLQEFKYNENRDLLEEFDLSI